MSKTLNNTIYYTIGAILRALASFILLPVFTNILGASQYGILNLLQTFSAILVTVMTLALERSLYRLYYDYKTDDEKNRFLSSVFWLICVYSLILILVSIILSNSISRYIGNVDVYTILLPVVIYTFLSSLVNFAQILLQVQQNGKQFFIISLMILIVYNVIALIFVVHYSGTVKSLVYASLITYVLVIPYAFGKIKKRIKLLIDKQCVYAVFKYSIPMLMAVVISWIINFSDRFFIANMTSYQNAGIYSLAAKIVSIITLFAGAIFQAYGPYFYNIANTLSDSDAKVKLKSANSIITLAICMMGMFIVIVSRSILDIFFLKEFDDALIYIYILTISMMLIQQSGMLNIMIYQNKKTLAISFVSIACGILSVTLNICLIPRFGAISAAYSNLIVGIFMISLTFQLARKNYYVDMNFPLVFYAMLFIIGCLICDLTIRSQWLSLVIKFSCMIIWGGIGLRLSMFDLATIQVVKRDLFFNHLKRL